MPRALQNRTTDKGAQVPGMKSMLDDSEEALYDGFVPEALKPIITAAMAASGNEKMEYKERLPDQWEEVVTKYLNDISGSDGTIGGKAKVDKELIDRVQKRFDKQISRWRAHKDMTGGFRTAEYHFSTTLFHEITRDFKGFNEIENDRFKPITWCHKGAKHAQGCDSSKAIEPMFFSEWVYNGLFARTYSMLSFMWQGLKDITPKLGDPLNCSKKNLASAGGDTPDDMNVTDENQGESNPAWCMAKNHNDTIGPVTNYHKTNYPALASEQAFMRGLHTARHYPQQDNRVHPVKATGPIGSTGAINRDKMMIFSSNFGSYGPGDLKQYLIEKLGTEEKGTHNKEFPKNGCQAFNNQQEITADWGGAAYGKANHLNLDYNGHRHARAHLRFIRCCPCGWSPLPGAPPTQIF
jgi:hypothetical protein